MRSYPGRSDRNVGDVDSEPIILAAMQGLSGQKSAEAVVPEQS
jgi:hypothetical protein